MRWRLWLILGLVTVGVQALAAPPKATPPRRGSVRETSPKPLAAARLPAWILIDAGGGSVLQEYDADRVFTSGDLNSLMVLLLTLEQARLGMMPLAAPVTVSPVAANLPSWRKRIPLRTDQVYDLTDLLKAVSLSAAEDASVAVAEAIGGSIDGCVELMNARAQRLGLDHTTYASVGGVSISEAAAPRDAMTARDLAMLARVLVRHPDTLGWSSLWGAPFAGGVVLRNANQLLGGVLGVDGLQVAVEHDPQGKPVGYDVVATAQRGALRLIAVVLGAADNAGRYGKVAELFEWGFSNFDAIEVLSQGDRLTLPIEVENGAVKQIQPIIGESLAFLRRHNASVDVSYRLQIPAVVRAPLIRHQPLGEVVVEREGRVVAAVPVLSPKDVRATAASLPGR